MRRQCRSDSLLSAAGCTELDSFGVIFWSGRGAPCTVPSAPSAPLACRVRLPDVLRCRKRRPIRPRSAERAPRSSTVGDQAICTTGMVQCGRRAPSISAFRDRQRHCAHPDTAASADRCPVRFSAAPPHAPQRRAWQACRTTSHSRMRGACSAVPLAQAPARTFDQSGQT